jgi:hypothetical protein
MFTASGLQVRFLKIIEKSNYQTVRNLSFIFPVLRVNLRFSGQVGEVHHQERRVPVQGLGSPSTCAKFCCVKEVSGISKSLITFLILTAAAPESLPCGNSVREADQLVIAC